MIMFKKVFHRCYEHVDKSVQELLVDKIRTKLLWIVNKIKNEVTRPVYK